MTSQAGAIGVLWSEAQLWLEWKQANPDSWGYS